MNQTFKGLALAAYFYALDELWEDGKRLSINNAYETIKTRVIDKIVENINFDLSDEDFTDINTGVKKAINDYFHKESKNG